MARQDILVISPVSEELLDLLQQDYTVHVLTDPRQRDRLITDGLGVRISAIVGHDPVDAALLSACPAAGLICTYAAGYENVDIELARRQGRMISNTPGASADEVGDTALMLLLAAMKRLPDLDALVRSGRWPEAGQPPPRRGLEGTPVGVAGAGAIGRAILSRLAPFGAQLHYHARNRRHHTAHYHPTLVGMAQTCDAIILAVPGGVATRHLADAQVFEALGSEGILVNVARGSVVDETALIEALSDGTLGFAALDVFESEPDVPQRLRDLPNTILTPHFAGASFQARRRKDAMVRASLNAYFSGELVPSRVV